MKTKWKTLNEWLEEQSQKTREEIEKTTDVDLVEKMQGVIMKQAEVIEYLGDKLRKAENETVEENEEEEDEYDDEDEEDFEFFKDKVKRALIEIITDSD